MINESLCKTCVNYVRAEFGAVSDSLDSYIMVRCLKDSSMFHIISRDRKDKDGNPLCISCNHWRINHD